jgi:hypothetical protein
MGAHNAFSMLPMNLPEFATHDEKFKMPTSHIAYCGAEKAGFEMVKKNVPQPRVVRTLKPMISTAVDHVIFFAMAFNSTSYILIIRSISEAVYAWFGSTPSLTCPAFF